MRLKRQRTDLAVLHRIFALWGHAECMWMQPRYENLIRAVEQWINKGEISDKLIKRIVKQSGDDLW